MAKVLHFIIYEKIKSANASYSSAFKCNVKSVVTYIVFSQLTFFLSFSFAQTNLNKTIYRKLNESSFAIVYINDCNQLLFQEPCQSNDTWYTLGLKLESAFKLPRQNLFVQAQMSSDLYTEKISDRIESEAGSLKKEIFTEINQMGFNIRPLNINNSFYPELGMSAGVINRDHALQYLALAIQSGLDGKGGYHQLVGQEPKINVSRQDFIKFLTLSPKINKIVVFYDHERRPIWMNFSLWADLSTHSSLNTLNHSLDISIPILARKNFLGSEIDLKLGEKTQFTNSGVAFTPGVSLETSFFNRLKIKAKTEVPLGAPNNFDLTKVKYDDKTEPLMNIKIMWRLNK